MWFQTSTGVLELILYGLGALCYPGNLWLQNLLMPCGLPPAVSWLWAGGRGEWRMGTEAEALQGLQSRPQLGLGFRVLTRRPSPHSKRHFPCAQPRMAQLCTWANPHSSQAHTAHDVPSFGFCLGGGGCLLVWLVWFGVLFVFSFLFCFVFPT